MRAVANPRMEMHGGEKHHRLEETNRPIRLATEKASHANHQVEKGPRLR